MTRPRRPHRARVRVRYHETQALRAVETHVLCPADPRYEATCSAAPEAAGWPDIQQDASRVDGDDVTLTHEMLPWGCHYRNLVSQAGHAWVAADLSADPQVKRATTEAAALSAAEDRSQPTPALLAYSDGSVTANGALGSAAAILCIGTHDVSAVVRLASADTALSSGRSEWTGLLQSPGRRFFYLASGGCKLQQTRPWLGLVDLSRIPSGTFFREVHPGSEMASQNDQNKAK